MVEILAEAGGEAPPSVLAAYLQVFLLPIILAIIAGISGSGGLWLYLNKRAERKHKQDPLTMLVLGLAHDRIIFLGKQYIKRGWVSMDEYEDYEKYLCSAYFTFGGNGLAEKVYNEVKALPFIDPNPTTPPPDVGGYLRDEDPSGR